MLHARFHLVSIRVASLLQRPHVLAAKLRKAGLKYQLLDNAFTHIDDWKAAQELVDKSETRLLHAKLDFYTSCFCPAMRRLGLSYQCNLAQVE